MALFVLLMDGFRYVFTDAALEAPMEFTSVAAALFCLLVLSTLLCVRLYCASLLRRISFAPHVITCPSSVPTTTYGAVARRDRRD